MSLVQTFISTNFIVVGGDQRAILGDGKQQDDIKKIHKLNNTTIIGMTGKILDNFRLFENFVNYDLSKRDVVIDETYPQLADIISERFNLYKKKKLIDNVYSIVCGWDGTKFSGRTFFINSSQKNLDYQGIFNITPSVGHPSFINCGKNEHGYKFKELYDINNHETILNFKNIFKNVIKAGVKFDDGINSNYDFEQIKRKDIGE